MMRPRKMMIRSNHQTSNYDRDSFNGCCGINKTVCSWFFQFILNQHFYFWVMIHACSKSVPKPLPCLNIIGLKTVVITVLPRPDINIRAIHFSGPVNNFLGFINTCLTSFGIGSSKTSLAPFSLSPQIGDKHGII